MSHGNARNIEAVLEAAAAGTPVWAVRGVLDADFTGVTGRLEPAGVELFADDDAMLAALGERAPGARAARETGAEPSGAAGPEDVETPPPAPPAGAARRAAGAQHRLARLPTPYTALTRGRSSPDPLPADCASKAVQGGHRDRQTIGDSHPRAA